MYSKHFDILQDMKGEAEPIRLVIDSRRGKEPPSISRWEIVGFNGTPVGKIGLMTPIVHDGQLSFCYKLDGLWDPIPVEKFDLLAQEGKLTPVRSLGGAARFDYTHPTQDLNLTVGFVKRDILVKLSLAGNQGHRVIDFDFDEEISMVRSSDPELSSKGNSFNLPLIEDTSHQNYLWLGTIDEGRKLLYWMSKGFMKFHDLSYANWTSNPPEEGIPSDVFEEIKLVGWDALACAYDNKELMRQAILRVALCTSQIEGEEKALHWAIKQGGPFLGLDIDPQTFTADLRQLPGQILAG